jgi:hypothetical protein
MAWTSALTDKSAVARSDPDKLPQNGKQPVATIRLIEAMKTVCPIHKQAGRQ